MTKDEDILNSFCVLAFDEVPNKNFTLKEYINRKADSTNKLNLVEKHLIAREVSKNLKDASAFYDSELKNYVTVQADFKQPESAKMIKSAYFGDVAFVDNKYHLVNPLTKKATAEFLIVAADANFAKLHELIGEARKAGYVDSVVDLDGDLVVTTRPNVSYELKQQIESLGYECEEVDQTNYDDVESVPTYNLRIKMSGKDNPAINNELPKEESVEVPVEKEAEKEEKIDFEKELMEAGESEGAKDKVNETQLEMGKEVEKEHTTNPEIAEKITRDHLEEIPDYYTHLKEMEENAKENDAVKSSYAPFITIDATKKDEVKVIAGEKIVGTCKDVKAAFEKSADWSSEELLIDDGTGVTVTYQVYDESELPVVWAALRHRDNGNVIMCSDAAYVGDLLGAEDHIDFLKDIKDFSNEFAKVGLDEEKVQHYQDQTNAKLKEIFQPQPGPDGGAAEVVESAKQEEDIEKKAEDGEDNVWVVEKTSAPTIDDQLKLDIFYVVNKNTNVVAHDAGFEPFLFPTQEEAQEHADKLNSQKEASAKPEVKKEAEDTTEYHVEIYTKLNPDDNPEGFDAERYDHDYFKTLEEAKEWANKNTADGKHYYEISLNDEIVESSEKDINKKADQELKQFDMKQELDGQKEFETQDDTLKDVSVPEEKEDTSEVTETMEAKPEETKGESFSASEFGNNLAYIQQNNPDSFKSIMNNLKQIMVGDEKKIYDFLENWSTHNFQDFTAMTREDPTYARHSQYQEQLKNNVLPKLQEMSEYKQAMEEKVSAEKGNVEASIREYDSSDPEDAAVYNHNGEDEGEED